MIITTRTQLTFASGNTVVQAVYRNSSIGPAVIITDEVYVVGTTCFNSVQAVDAIAKLFKKGERHEMTTDERVQIGTAIEAAFFA